MSSSIENSNGCVVGPSGEESASGSSAVRSRSVLVADDHDDARRLFAMLLSGAGYAVQEARDGQEAVTLALRTSFDLILMDLRMPVLSGDEAMSKLRAAGVRAKFLAITADAFPAAKDRAFAAGADAFVTKPITQATLLAQCQSLLADNSFSVTAST